MHIGYYEIAENEYKYLIEQKTQMSYKYNNGIAGQCQHIAECLLKSVLQAVCEDKQLLRCRKLDRLYKRIYECGVNLQLSYSELNYLTSVGLGSAYPGDDYVDVSDLMLDRCWATMEAARNAVLKWRSEQEKPKKQTEERLGSLFNKASGD